MPQSGIPQTAAEIAAAINAELEGHEFYTRHNVYKYPEPRWCVIEIHQATPDGICKERIAFLSGMEVPMAALQEFAATYEWIVRNQKGTRGLVRAALTLKERWIELEFKSPGADPYRYGVQTKNGAK